MNAVPGRVLKNPERDASFLDSYRGEAGTSIVTWLIIALLNAAAQIVFRRNLVDGEFATLNSILGAIALTAAPVLAVRQAFAFFQPSTPGPEILAKLREARVPLVQNTALVWAFICALLFLPALGLLHLPRIWIWLLALPTALATVSAVVSATVYEQQNKLRFWTFLLGLAGLVRLAIAWKLTAAVPWAEAALAAGLCAAFILLIPILRQNRIDFGWRKMLAALDDREFLIFLAATISVMVGIFLFTNADRIVAQAWFGQAADNNMGLVRWSLFDGYQAAGLLGRSLLWGTQPLLLVLLARRAARDRTLRADYLLLWIYFGALIIGALLFFLLAQPLARLFGGGDPGTTAYFIPGFATAMIPLGLLQGLGFFALASRRYPECFALGLAGIVYAVFLLWEGRPQIMLTCMFGGGIAALMAVLFLGVVRWGRQQP